MISSNFPSRLILGLVALASTGVLAFGNNIVVPGGLFDTSGPSISAYGFENGVWTGPNNPYYTNQNPAGANPYPDAELFSGWVTTASNYQAYETSTAGTSGLAGGVSSMVQVNNSQGSTTVSLNPVVSSIDLNATYTFTLSLASAASNNSPITMQLVSTTSAPDPHNYDTGTTFPDNYTTSTSLLGTQSPYNPTPTITSTVLESRTISAADLNAQGANTFQDYALSLDTTPTGVDVADAGQNLSLLIYVGGGGGTVYFTNARLTEDAVPEPGTWAMMLVGAAGLLFVARRRMA